MRYETVPVNNVRRLQTAMNDLTTRAPAMPGLAVLRGTAGFGKTTAAAFIGVQFDAAYVRALAVWTPTAMLEALCEELGIKEPARSKARMMAQIIEVLDARPQPIIVDEADYIMGDKQMAETLRDLHDMCGVAIIMIGMDQLWRAIAARKQIASRVAHDIVFQALDIKDTGLVARKLCEVEVSDDLIKLLHDAAGGNIRNICNGLAHIEAKARTMGVAAMTLAAWGDAPLFFSHQAQRRKSGPALVAA